MDPDDVWRVPGKINLFGSAGEASSANEMEVVCWFDGTMDCDDGRNVLESDGEAGSVYEMEIDDRSTVLDVSLAGSSDSDNAMHSDDGREVPGKNDPFASGGEADSKDEMQIAAVDVLEVVCRLFLRDLDIASTSCLTGTSLSDPPVSFTVCATTYATSS